MEVPKFTEFQQAEWDRYTAAAHAMQSGVAGKMSVQVGETSGKHLRVGINAAMVHEAALAKLLIAKGIITMDEHLTALADEMERERDRYAAELTELFGKPVTLG